MENDNVKVIVIKGGPLVISSTMSITHIDGKEETKQDRASFCRCGASANMPFCDGKHKGLEFDV